MDLTEYIPHLSASQLDTFRRCPQQWYYSYVEGLKIPPGIALLVGSGVHKGAEVDLKTKIVTGQDEPLDVVLDAAVTEYDSRMRKEGLFLTRDEMAAKAQTIGAGKDETVALASLWHEESAPEILPAMVEERMSIDAPGLAVPLFGIIDLYEQDGVLRDLKTAKSQWRQDKADTETQPTLYRELIMARTGEYPRMVAYDILVKTKKPKRQQLATERTQADFDVLVGRAQLMLRQIKAGIFPPADPGQWWCSPKFCGYYGFCKHIPDRLRRLPNV